MRRVVVTGGTGFIGQYVCEELDDRGIEPIVFDTRGKRRDYGVHLGDIRDEVAVVEAFAHADGFIHLAAVLGTQETIANPRPAVHTNIQGGLNVLEAAAQYGIPGVYIGVGNHWMNNTYSISKTCVERFVAMFNAERNTSVNIVRVVNAYGPRQLAAHPFGPGKVRKIIPAFACRAIRDQPIEIYGDGEQISDMVYVEDVARALVQSLECADDGHVYQTAVEIGPKTHTTVNQIAELVIEVARSKSEIIHLPMRPGEIPGAVVTADTDTLAQIDMDVSTLLPLHAGLEKTVDYFRNLT